MERYDLDYKGDSYKSVHGDWIKYEDYLIEKGIQEIIIRELKSVIVDLTKETLNKT